MRRLTLLLIATVAATALPGPGSAHAVERRPETAVGWPSYRFDVGHSASNPFETVLGPSNVAQLTESWVRNVDHYATPNPVIVDGVMYVTSYFGLVYGFDVATGRSVWKVHTLGLMSGAAPAVVDGRLYAGTLDGDAIAFDLATRRELWRVPLGAAAELAPTALEGVVYYSAGVVHALDASTGAELWASEGHPAFSSPAIDNGLLYVQSGLSVLAMDPLDGAIVWDTRVQGYPNEIAAAEGVVAVGSTDSRVYLLDGVTGQQRWKRNVRGFASSPAIADGTVYVMANAPNSIRAFDLQSGAFLWQSSERFDGEDLIEANGVLYFGERAQIVAVDASDGEVLWRSPSLRDQSVGVPIVTDGVVYGSTYSGRIQAFSLP